MFVIISLSTLCGIVSSTSCFSLLGGAAMTAAAATITSHTKNTSCSHEKTEEANVEIMSDGYGFSIHIK